MKPRSMKRGCTAVLAAATAVASLAACGGSNGSKDDASSPFKVYVSIDLSGATKTYSVPIVDGLEIAAAKINKAGGIQGRKVEIEKADDQNNPTKAVSLLQKQMSSGDEPDLVYAGGSSSVTLSLLPVLSRNKIVSMSGTVSNVLNDPKKYPYHFSVSAPGSAYAPAQAAEAVAQGYKKIAMLFSNDATGQSTLKLYKEAFEDAGIELVSAGYDATALDMTSQLQQLKGKDPDALVINGYGTAALYAFRGRAQIGWNIPTYGDQLSSSFPLVKNLKASELENVKIVTSSTGVVDGNQSDLVAGLVEEIKAGENAASLGTTGYGLFATGYDILELINFAAEQAKSTDMTKVNSALEDLKVDGDVPWVSGGKSGDAILFDYSKTNHFPTAGDGLIVFVAPGSYNADGLYEPGKR